MNGKQKGHVCEWCGDDEGIATKCTMRLDDGSE
jgi:hypothetical protein